MQVAKSLFSECGEQPDFAHFYLARARLYSDDDAYDAEMDLLRAAELKEDEWRVSSQLIDYYLGKNDAAQALNIADEAVKSFPGNDVLKYEHAKCLLANGQYTACQKALATTVILPSEGARYGRFTYRQACLMEGVEFYNSKKIKSALGSIQKAREWPENLGVGRPFVVDERIEDFFEATCLTARNRTKDAERLYSKVMEFTRNTGRRHSSTDYLYLLSMKQMNREDEIDNFLSEWEQSSSGDPMLAWCRAMIQGDEAAAKKIEQDINTQEGGTPWDPKYSDPEFEIVKAINRVLDH
jgi:tetratricopeptide (TPR) repeat protein